MLTIATSRQVEEALLRQIKSPSHQLGRTAQTGEMASPGRFRCYSAGSNCRRARPALAQHSHCSHRLASGVPLPAVSARLGHGSIRTTQEIYSHMIHGQDDAAAEAWEKFQNQAKVGVPEVKGQVHVSFVTPQEQWAPRSATREPRGQHNDLTLRLFPLCSNGPAPPSGP
jgi:hypothetical protein